LTCEVTNFIEEGSDLDEKLSEGSLFQTMWTDAIEFCKICQKTYSSHRQQIYQQKEVQVKQMTKSASELTFFVCQMLSQPTKFEFQTILNENNIEKRLQIVSSFLQKEVAAKRTQQKKMEALNKRIKERISNQNGDEDTKDEITQLQAKL
jgi:ATP-dependent Lon protease